MGMFDTQSSKPFSDAFGPGEVFTLTATRLIEGVQTEFGVGTLCILTVNGENLSLFGKGIESQIRLQEDGDLPAKVKLAYRAAKRKGQSPMKVLAPSTATLDDKHCIVELDAASDDIPF